QCCEDLGISLQGTELQRARLAACFIQPTLPAQKKLLKIPTGNIREQNRNRRANNHPEPHAFPSCQRETDFKLRSPSRPIVRAKEKQVVEIQAVTDVSEKRKPARRSILFPPAGCSQKQESQQARKFQIPGDPLQRFTNSGHSGCYSERDSRGADQNP